MKKTVIITFILLIVFSSFSFNSNIVKAGEVVSVVDSNKENINSLASEVKNVDGREMISLRKLGDKYNWNFAYDSQDKIVSIYAENDKIEFKIGESIVKSDKLPKKSTIPEIINGRTYIDIMIINNILEELGEPEVKLMTTLNVENNTIKVGESFKAFIGIYNLSDENIRLHYSSGQLYDLYLKRGDKTLWRWSEGKYFTMALQYKDLPAGEKMNYEVEVSVKAGPGDEYVLGGEISTKGPLALPEVEIEIIK